MDPQTTEEPRTSHKPKVDTQIERIPLCIGLLPPKPGQMVTLASKLIKSNLTLDGDSLGKYC